MHRLFRPLDIASLVAFRLAFGALMLCAVGRYFAHGWIDQFFVAPRLFFPYPGLAWLAPLPHGGMYLLYALLGALALCVLLGLWYRASAALFCIGFSYAHLIDRTNYLNHYHLVTLLSLLLVFVPAHRAYSLDVWRGTAPRRATAPAWSIWILRFQLGVVYVFGAVAKLNPDWLLTAQPLRIWLGANVDTPIVGALFEQAWVAYAFSYAGLLFDLSIVPLLLWRRTRAAAYGAVVVFHLLTAWLFPIGMFPWIMMLLTPIFFAPDWPRRWRQARSAPAALPAAPQWTAARVCGIAAAGLYVLLQIALPARHFAYPGDVHWTESGFRFAWQIMVMEKYGQASFRVSDPDRGDAWSADPRAVLTPLQARMMATQPDMVLSFAHYLAAEARAAGHQRVEVRADVYASLNGRPNQRLIDPDVDLAAVPEWSDRRDWVLPLQPRHTSERTESAHAGPTGCNVYELM